MGRYLLADLVVVLLADVFRYRRGVITRNLKRSLPHLNRTELQRVMRAYYRHLADVLLETLQLSVLTAKGLRKRIRLEGEEVFMNYAAQGRSVVIISAHQGNWEWSGPRLVLDVPPATFPIYGIYKRLKSPTFDRLLHRARSRTGMRLVEYADTLRAMVAARQDGPSAFAFISDQTPHENQGHWVQFLHQDTQFFTGAAKLAQRFDCPMVWIRSFRTARGQYAVSCTVFEDQPKAYMIEQLTERFAAELEADIHQYPEQWLWSHKRWKHKRTKPAQQAVQA